MKRIIVGGILAGLVLFVWSFIAHDVLPFGTAGLRMMPPAQEEAVVAAMRGAMNEQALYLFPGMSRGVKMTTEDQNAWKSKYSAGPAGLIAYSPHPADRTPVERLFPTIISIELAGDVLAGLLAAVIMCHLPASLGMLRRALLVGMLGVLMTVDVDVSYWNWYGFPATYTLAQLADHGVGYLLAGFVLARIYRE